MLFHLPLLAIDLTNKTVVKWLNIYLYFVPYQYDHYEIFLITRQYAFIGSLGCAKYGYDPDIVI